MTEDIYKGYRDYEMVSEEIDQIYSEGLALPEELEGHVLSQWILTYKKYQ